MDDHRRRNVQGVGRQVPGCLGRMVNLFDYGTGVGGHKMLADKSHLDGSSLLCSRSDVPQIPNPPIEDQIEDKVVVSEVRNTTDGVKKTPIKKLIAQEMSKERDCWFSPSNVVAKLMGLDSLPQQQPKKFARRMNLKGRSRLALSHESTALQCWEQDCDPGYQDHPEYKDVYEIWQQPHKLNNSGISVADGGRYNWSLSEKNMDVVREKFMEAKRLVTDEKLRHSKEFQDAVEVLSSNKDLFVKFLQESDTFFSQCLHDFQSVATSPDTKRITILKPSKMAEDESLPGQVTIKKNHKWTNKATPGSSWGSMYTDFGFPFHHKRVEDYPMQSTRIVVLKPNPANGQHVTAKDSSCSKFPEGLHGKGYNEALEDIEEGDLRGVARRVARQMHTNLVEFQQDETLQSSVFSNGYVGDDSSFNRSENDYVVENLSDSEIMSPASRHSWDYIKRYGSPYSLSPISRASCSPESSVFREAKKWLSERCASMASNGIFQEQNGIQKSSSTLAEMLVLSDSENIPRTKEADNNDKQDPRVSTSCLTSNISRDEGISNSPRSLQRSKSAPQYSTVRKTNLEFRVSDAKDKANVPEELTKSRSLKSSLKGKVSNFFFSRSKKASKEKSNTFWSRDEPQAATSERVDSPAALLAQAYCHASHSANDGYPEQGSLLCTGQKGSIVSCEADLSTARQTLLGIASESCDQPSPISVLETSFEGDDRITLDSSILAKPASWDTDGDEEEEEDWRPLFSALLSAADLEAVSLWDNPLARWHSAGSPLYPSLRNKYANEAKQQRLRSWRKLVFDLVNSLLLEMATRNNSFLNVKQRKTLGDHVWTRMQEWFSDKEEELWDEDCDLSSLAVDRLVRWEVAEKCWPETMRFEMDEMGTEFEAKLVEELVEESVTELTRAAVLTI